MSDKNGCIWELLFWFGILAAMWLYSEHIDSRKEEAKRNSTRTYTVKNQEIDEGYEDQLSRDRILDEAYEGLSPYDRWR